MNSTSHSITILITKAIIIALFSWTSMLMHAADYNRISLSASISSESGYNENGYNKVYYTPILSGPAIEYVHGFQIANHSFIEAGCNISRLTGDNFSTITPDNDGLVHANFKHTYRSCNFQIPIHYVYNITLTPKISLPFCIGLNLRYHLSAKVKTTLTEYYGKEIIGEYESNGWTNLFTSGALMSDTSINKWKRCQLGISFGFGFNICRIYCGFRYSQEITPLYSNINSERSKNIISGCAHISIGYIF